MDQLWIPLYLSLVVIIIHFDCTHMIHGAVYLVGKLYVFQNLLYILLYNLFKKILSQFE